MEPLWNKEDWWSYRQSTKKTPVEKCQALLEREFEEEISNAECVNKEEESMGATYGYDF